MRFINLDANTVFDEKELVSLTSSRGLFIVLQFWQVRLQALVSVPEVEQRLSMRCKNLTK